MRSVLSNLFKESRRKNTEIRIEKNNENIKLKYFRNEAKILVYAQGAHNTGTR